jgi:hypothetical protein
MLEVTAADYVDGHRIRLAFSNGKQGTVDLRDSLWGPMFEPLRDLSMFQKFEVSPVVHTIRWENDADLAPEYLYAKMVEQSHALEPAAGPVSNGEPSPPAQ